MGKEVQKMRRFILFLTSMQIFRQVAQIIPFNPTFEQACNIVCSPEHKHLMNNLDVEALVDTIVKVNPLVSPQNLHVFVYIYFYQPLRTILDRGGKHWRSYILAACIDSVGGDSNQFKQCLVFSTKCKEKVESIIVCNRG
jgi:hypothetical protein